MAAQCLQPQTRSPRWSFKTRDVVGRHHSMIASRAGWVCSLVMKKIAAFVICIQWFRLYHKKSLLVHWLKEHKKLNYSSWNSRCPWAVSEQFLAPARVHCVPGSRAAGGRKHKRCLKHSSWTALGYRSLLHKPWRIAEERFSLFASLILPQSPPYWIFKVCSVHPGAFSLVNIFDMNLSIEMADHPGVSELCVGLTLTVNADISCL